MAENNENTTYDSLLSAGVISKVEVPEGEEWNESKLLEKAISNQKEEAVASFEEGLPKDVKVLREALDKGYNVEEYKGINSEISALDNFDPSKVTETDALNAYSYLTGNTDKDEVEAIVAALAKKGTLLGKLKTLSTTKKANLKDSLKTKELQMATAKEEAIAKYTKEAIPLTTRIENITHVLGAEVSAEEKKEMVSLIKPNSKGKSELYAVLNDPTNAGKLAYLISKGALKENSKFSLSSKKKEETPNKQKSGSITKDFLEKFKADLNK